LALSSGAPLPETFLEKARPVVQREAVRRDEWRKEIRKHDPDRNGDLLKLEDWSGAPRPLPRWTCMWPGCSRARRCRGSTACSA
jgi:hypothetical protein